MSNICMARLAQGRGGVAHKLSTSLNQRRSEVLREGVRGGAGYPLNLDFRDEHSYSWFHISLELMSRHLPALQAYLGDCYDGLR